MFCNYLVPFFQAGVNQTVSDTLQRDIRHINDCLYQIENGLYSATLDLKKAFENVLQ